MTRSQPERSLWRSVVLGGAAILLSALILRECWSRKAEAACTPDPAYTPTPTITWDRPVCAGATSIACWNAPIPPGEDCPIGCYVGGSRPDGYVLRWRHLGTAFDDQRRMVLTCRNEFDPDTGAVIGRFCPGRDLPYPVQRFNSSQLEEIEYVVSAYAGEPTVANEGGLSNVAGICMTQICAPPGPCS